MRTRYIACTVAVTALCAYKAYRENYRFRHGKNSRPPIEAWTTAKWHMIGIDHDLEKVLRTTAKD